jgi:hypothetical protein
MYTLEVSQSLIGIPETFVRLVKICNDGSQLQSLQLSALGKEPKNLHFEWVLDDIDAADPMTLKAAHWEKLRHMCTRTHEQGSS